MLATAPDSPFTPGSERSNFFQGEEVLSALQKLSGHYLVLGVEQLFPLPPTDTQSCDGKCSQTRKLQSYGWLCSLNLLLELANSNPACGTAMHWFARGLAFPSVTRIDGTPWSSSESEFHIILICEHVALMCMCRKVAKTIVEVPFISWWAFSYFIVVTGCLMHSH